MGHRVVQGGVNIGRGRARTWTNMPPMPIHERRKPTSREPYDNSCAHSDASTLVLQNRRSKDRRVG